MDLSIIVPLYNEEDSVEPLYRAIVEAVTPLRLEHEIVFVDDGSQDETVPRARALAQTDSRLRIVKFRKNYGQTPAMVAGIEHARGSNPRYHGWRPIPQLLEKIEEGYDIVAGWRFQRQDKLITRKVPSVIANWLIGKVTGVPLRDNGCSLKAYRANVIGEIPLYSEMHRFIPAMSSLAGAKICQVKVRHHARRHGTSKYGLSRIYKVLLDLIVIKTILSFLARPLQAFALLAATVAVPAAFAAIGAVNQYWQSATDSNLVLSSVAFLLSSLSLFLLLWGTLAEFVYRTGDTKAERFAVVKLEASG